MKFAMKKRSCWGSAFTALFAMAALECEAFAVGDLSQQSVSGMARSFLQTVDQRDDSLAPVNPQFIEWCRRQERQADEPESADTRSFGGTQAPEGELCGTLPSPIDYSYLKDLRAQDSRSLGFAPETPLPARYDLRQEHRVTPVKKQSPYGTCWAHATLGSLESSMLSQGRGTFDFSEKHLANTHGWSCGNGFGGAFPETALAYFVRWSGPIDEAEDPYPDSRPYDEWVNNGKKGPIVVPPSPKGTPLGHVQNAIRLSPMSNPGDTEEIKRAVMAYGGVYADYIHAFGALSGDSTSYYWDGAHPKVESDQDGGGHAVLIVGWDDAYPRSKFKYTPPSDGAFLAKNSWGPNWGDNGCFWVSYCDSHFGRDGVWAFHQLESPENYGDIYQHDFLGKTASYGRGETMWGANVFTARKNDALAAVGFYANVPRTQYEISVYTDCPEGNPVGGTRRLVQSGVSTHCGYVTVPLDNAVPVEQGRRFGVVLKLTTPGYRYPLAVEDPDFPTSRATSSKGESFYSADGIQWTDYADAYPNGNICIKAYTKAHGSSSGSEKKMAGDPGKLSGWPLDPGNLNPAFIEWQDSLQKGRGGRGSGAAHDVKTEIIDGVRYEWSQVSDGLIPSPIDFAYLSDRNHRLDAAAWGALPTRYDSRREFSMTPVRHQDPHGQRIGTCWAQATVGSMETWLAKNTRTPQQLSVKNLVNGTGYDRGDPEKPRGWFGGNIWMSAAYLLRWGGPVSEAKDPYLNPDGSVNFSLDSPNLPAEWHLQHTRLVPPRTGPLDNAALKRAVMEFGGLYTAMKLYNPYASAGTEKRLIPYWNTNGAYYCRETGQGHAVTLVGWDDTYSRENFNPKFRPDGDGAFIVKDSYGNDAPRDGGYIYVSYYDTTFAYIESCAFPMLEGAGNYGAIYQYDPLGLTAILPLEASAFWMANLFTAEENATVEAVGTHLLSPSAPYVVSVYTDCSPDDPASGRKCAEQRGRAGDYAGYYTIKLNQGVAVRKGQRFSVVVELDASSDGNVMLPYEHPEKGYTSRATASAGQSFFSAVGPGGRWYDFWDASEGTANFCIKAYTSGRDSAQISGTIGKDSPAILPVDSVSTLPQTDPSPRDEKHRGGEGVWENLPQDAFK